MSTDRTQLIGPGPDLLGDLYREAREKFRSDWPGVSSRVEAQELKKALESANAQPNG